MGKSCCGGLDAHKVHCFKPSTLLGNKSQQKLLGYIPDKHHNANKQHNKKDCCTGHEHTHDSNKPVNQESFFSSFCNYKTAFDFLAVVGTAALVWCVLYADKNPKVMINLKELCSKHFFQGADFIISR